MSALAFVAHAQSEPEADMLCARLADAGIPAVVKRNLDNPEFGAGGGRDIYVDDHLEARARDLLATPEFSDDELARLAEEAGPAPE